MKRREIASLAKNAVSTVFLLAGAFFVCSTFLSMRAVFADPVAPVAVSTVGANTASPRANATSRASARSSGALRVRGTTGSVSRANNTATARNVVSRAGTVSRSNTATSRGVAQRGVTQRGTVSRNVVARTTQTQTPSRVSLSGSAIRGSYGTSAAATNTYTYLSNKLYSGNYSNIIDSTTGLISAEAYQTCLESYYTCMDEICTARSAAQGRCACAARVKSFIQAEEALETANEELIKASGELALLIANKGKDVSQAFQLTDAEKVMNCVSWQEENEKASADTSTKSSTMTTWCQNHGIYDTSKCGADKAPTYCSESGNNFGFDIKNIDGSSSDILASLQSWAASKEGTTKLLTTDDNNLLTSFTNVSNFVSGLTNSASSSSDTTLDSLANTWGYELFQYAHNNVCGRVLDSCFNGIYEACGTPPSVSIKGTSGATTTLCANSATSNCPFNYNSKVAISSEGDVTLNERGSSNATTASSAACFGYSTSTTTSGTTTTTDPYASLRGPVADARRSVMQKYLLDANAACDVYGDALKKTAQNIGYQKVAAQQALQQKRLEFDQEERSSVLNNAVAAATNFDNCISEILECYETQKNAHGVNSSSTWTDSRIKTYCAQIANVPSCYEDMICNPSTAQFKAIIDKADSASCFNSSDYKQNTCRNIVTLNEILNGASKAHGYISAGGTGDSASFREQCLLDAGIEEVRTWATTTAVNTRCSIAEVAAVDPNGYSAYKTSAGGTCILTACNSGYLLVDGGCVLASTDCTSEIPGAASASRTLGNDGSWSACVLGSCKTNYTKNGNTCVADVVDCSQAMLNAANATAGTQTWDGSAWTECTFTACASGYTLTGNTCVAD